MSYLPTAPKASTATPPESIAIPHSSFLQVATYDATNYALTLDFKNGTQVVHRFVFPIVWAQFKEQSSHGSFYSRMIKVKYPSVNFRMPLKVSDLKKAIKEKRHDATIRH